MGIAVPEQRDQVGVDQSLFQGLQHVAGDLDPEVPVALFGTDSPLLHLQDGHTLVHGGQKIDPLLCAGAVIDSAVQPRSARCLVA